MNRAALACRERGATDVYAVATPRPGRVALGARGESRHHAPRRPVRCQPRRRGSTDRGRGKPDRVAAVVSRGGRPDLAVAVLDRVRAPTLLIVGGADHGVIELNERALQALTCERRIHIVPGATHLFEEPGKLDEVVEAAGDWFETHLPDSQS